MQCNARPRNSYLRQQELLRWGEKHHGNRELCSNEKLTVLWAWVNGNSMGKTRRRAKRNIFTARYVNGVRNGFGKFRWNDGSSYNGEFRDNKIEGNGKCAWADLRV